MSKKIHQLDYGAVITAQFPFSDMPIKKWRPCLVLSSKDLTHATGTVILAMISSSTKNVWPNDTTINDYIACGLKSPSFVRAKIFSLTSNFVAEVLGSLSKSDLASVKDNLKTAMPVFA